MDIFKTLKLDKSALERDAKEAGIRHDLFLNWCLIMQFLFNILPQKSKYTFVNGENEIIAQKDYTIKCTFVNKSYLELSVSKGKDELMLMRLIPELFTINYLSVLSAHILLVLETWIDHGKDNAKIH